MELDEVTEFFKAPGHNMMVFADLDVRRYTRNIGLTFGVDFEP